MNGQLKKTEVMELVNALTDAKVINLDASIQNLVEPLAATLQHAEENARLHICIIDDYYLVTRSTSELDMDGIRQQIESLRCALELDRK